MKILYRKTYSTADCQIGTGVENEEVAVRLGGIRQTRDAEFAYSQQGDAQRDPAQARLRRAHDPDRGGDHQQIPGKDVIRPLPDKCAAEIAPECEAAGAPTVSGGVLEAEVGEIQGSHLRRLDRQSLVQ